MWAVVSSSHVVSAAPSSSGGGLLTLCPCSSMRSFSRETVLHKVLQSESFPWAAALHKLFQHGSLPRVQSFRNKLLQHGTPRGHKPCQQTCSSVGSSLHGSTRSSRSLLQHRSSMGSQPPLDIPLVWHGSLPWPAGGGLLHHGPPWAAGAQPASPWAAPRAAGNLCSGTSSSSFCTDLGVCKIVSLT